MQLELDARDLVAPPEVADVTRHPALGALLVAGPDRVQQQGVDHARGDRLVPGPAHRHELRARTPLHEAAALELAQRLAHGGAVDAELPRQLRFRGQPLALAQRAGEDPPTDRRGHLAIGGLDEERGELDAHPAASNSSRPISMRRISWVPAPIS